MNAHPASIPSAGSGLASDPTLPQRDLLLDEQQTAARLSLLIDRNGPSVIDSCEIQRIKYRIAKPASTLQGIREWLPSFGRRQSIC